MYCSALREGSLAPNTTYVKQIITETDLRLHVEKMQEEKTCTTKHPARKAEAASLVANYQITRKVANLYKELISV